MPLTPSQQRALEQRLTRARKGVPPADGNVPAPLSLAQQRLWFLAQLDPADPSYNVPLAWRIDRSRERALERAIEIVVRRHAVFRTSFIADETGPRQHIDDVTEFRLERHDFSSAEDPGRSATSWALADAVRPFDLSIGPLLRGAFLQIDASDGLLYLCTHHIIFDAWSARILVEEIGQLAFSDQEEAELPELPLQFSDYARWQRSRGERIQTQLEYWRRRLTPLPVMRLPPRVGPTSGRSVVSERLEVPESTATRLRELAAETGATIFTVALAGLMGVLGRWCHTSDVAVAVPAAGRLIPEVERLIGFFVNTLVIRADLREGADFARIVREVGRAIVDGMDNQEVPFDEVVRHLGVAGQPNSPVRAAVMFQLLERPASDASVAESVLGTPVSFAPVYRSKFPMEITLFSTGTGLNGELIADATVIDPADARRIADAFLFTLDAVARDGNASLARLPLTALAPVRQLRRATPAHEGGVLDWFRAWVESSPHSIAVRASTTAITYRQLDRLSDQFASQLRRRGVCSGDLVGTFLERSSSFIISVLAIWKCGAAYVPLDVDSPDKRVESMVDSLSLRAIIVGTPHERFRVPVPVVPFDASAARYTVESTRIARPLDAVAYVILTSGTSGRPKAVAVTDTALAMSTAARSTPDRQRFLVVSPVTFDSSLAGIFSTLATGGELVLLPHSDSRDPAAILRALQTGTTETLMTPSLYSAVLGLGEHLPPTLACVRLGGEIVTSALCDLHDRLAPAAELINEYGPTEATVWATSFRHDPTAPTADVPIGSAISGVRAQVFDRELERTPDMFPGELCISGSTLALGYLGDPRATAEKFVPHPSGPAGARMYRTGDLARVLADGNLQFLGRLDRQVKIRGHRVDPVEIENALIRLVGIRAAAVRVSEDHAQLLCAYVETDGQHNSISTADIRAQLRRALPDYLVPSRVGVISTMPLTDRGKIDYARLPILHETSTDAAEVDGPTTTTECELARLWGELLDTAVRSRSDDFFELGGHSLLVAQLVGRIRSLFDKDVTVRAIFDHPQLSTMATVIDAAMPAAASGVRPRPRATTPSAALIRDE